MRHASYRQTMYGSNYDCNRNATPTKWDKIGFWTIISAPLWVFPLISIVLNAVYTIPIGIAIFVAYKIINQKKRG